MEQRNELQREQAYTARVQQLLLAMIEKAQIISQDHLRSIQAIVADAWEDLRVKPTALSEEDMEQLSTEVDRFAARRDFARGLEERSRRMLTDPFFARVDFIEEGETRAEKIVIGLYSLRGEGGELLVHDWRAPVCSLYYDAMPGPAGYMSPSGLLRGELTLKRQYRMDKGRLVYYVDTGLSIDDTLLLDILSGATDRHMRQIVATIQAEQNAAIRQEDARVVSVVGCAGSGKTSVAMHRAAWLMYRRRDVLDASRILILSPSVAFSEHISQVLPQLGEENIGSRTLAQIVEQVLGRKAEKPYQQTEALLRSAEGGLRRRSAAFKGGASFLQRLQRFADTFAAAGPAFEDVSLDGQVLIRREELSRMYRGELSLLTPAQKLQRMDATLQTRLEGWEERLYRQYEKSLSGRYSQRELRQMCNIAVAQKLRPVRAKLRQMLRPTDGEMLLRAMNDAPRPMRQALQDNLVAGITWWEDAVAEAWLRVRLGFFQPQKQIYHLLVDECQDYTDTALSMLRMIYPKARCTLLGDPRQRTTPGMEPCDPARWGDCFGEPQAPMFTLSRCYRSTRQITRLCNRLLPPGEGPEPFGRDGEAPLVAPFSQALLNETLQQMRQKGYRSIAVLTRSQGEADRLSAGLDRVYRLDGGEDDLNYELGDTVVACCGMTRGMEFDAVVVVWPDVPLTNEERRRLYSAASRALHALTVLGDGKLCAELAGEEA